MSHSILSKFILLSLFLLIGSLFSQNPATLEYTAEDTAEGTLEPEESAQIEFGVKNNLLNGKIHSTLSVYQLEKQNIAIPNNNGVMRQVGDQRSRGLEFEVQAQMLAKCASIFADIYTDAEMTDFAETVTIGVDPMGMPIMRILNRSGNQAAVAPQPIVNI